MKRLILGSTIAVAIAVAVSLAVGLGSAPAAGGSSSPSATVEIAHSGLGSILVDGRGRTLYLFEKDKHGKSTCSGQCASFWPPVITAGKPHATAGAKASLLGTTRRSDGRLQVTYNHHPLYAFVKDTARGQANGEELSAFGGEWYAVSAAGTKVEKTATSSTGSTPPGTGGGYGGYGGY